MLTQYAYDGIYTNYIKTIIHNSCIMHIVKLTFNNLEYRIDRTHNTKIDNMFQSVSWHLSRQNPDQ